MRRPVKRLLLGLCVVSLLEECSLVSAEPSIDTTVYADTYYAYDLNDLPSRFRPYTTQAYYNDEYALGLGYVSGELTDDDFRGRLAMQYGSAVVANYAAEPDEFWRYFQEAYAGYRLAPRVWLDAGIYFSHIGCESFISSRDITYTRSLIADNSPYYQSGARLSYEASDELKAQLHLLRGWQNISADESVSLGTQVVWGKATGFQMTYNTFLGDIHGTRFFQDFIFLYQAESGWKTSFSVDVGVQEQREFDQTAWWHGWSLVTQYPASESIRVGGRVERFADPHKVVIEAVNGKSVNFTGLSTNIDWDVGEYLLWRNEYRVLFDTESVFPQGDGFRDYDQVVVSSLTFTFDRRV